MTSSSSQPNTRRTARMSTIPQRMKKLALSDHEIEIGHLECQLHQEKQEKEELIEVLDNLQKENRDLKEHNEHLRTDVQSLPITIARPKNNVMWQEVSLRPLSLQFMSWIAYAARCSRKLKRYRRRFSKLF